MTVASAGKAKQTEVLYGGVQTVLSGGTTEDTRVCFNGTMNISAGGKTTGRMLFEVGANVIIETGGIVDFNISNLVPSNTPLVNNHSLIQGEALYTLTVSPDMASGIYRLADGALGFNEMIAVHDTDGTLLNTLMLSQRAYIGGVNYLLDKNSSHLTISVINTRTETPDFFNGRFSGSDSSVFAAQYEDSVLFYAAGTGWGAPLSLDPGWDAVGAGDFDGDGKDDVLRINADGYVAGEFSNGNGTFSPSQVLNMLGTGWSILGIGDFNGNDTDDVLVANPTAASATTGLIGYWEGGTTWTLIDGYSSNDWWVAGTGDFNGDGKCDILWQNSFISEVDGLTYNKYGTMLVYNNSTTWNPSFYTANPDMWNFLCAGDFDGDETDDIAMINGSGVVNIWRVVDGIMQSDSVLSMVDTSEWKFATVGDFNGDGTDDIMWAHTDGAVYAADRYGYWQIDDGQLASWESGSAGLIFISERLQPIYATLA